MKSRIAYHQVVPEGYKGLLGLEEIIHQFSLEAPLMHLVKLRASLINGCAYCIDMHWKDLRALGETENRLYGLNAWEEMPWYSARERAALAWTDEVTRISETHASDAAYASVREQFSEKELAELTLVIAIINAWNRMAISFRVEPGHYRSKLQPAVPLSSQRKPEGVVV